MPVISVLAAFLFAFSSSLIENGEFISFFPNHLQDNTSHHPIIPNQMLLWLVKDYDQEWPVL